MNIGASIGAVAGAALDAANAVMKNVPSAGGGHFVVNHDNILAAAKIIQNQVDALSERLEEARYELRIVGPGDDVVSEKVAQAWNDRLVNDDDSYSFRVDEYVQSLRNLVIQLIDSAKNYGYNEDEIATALGGSSA
ncbi:hypothetical protein [Actinokineospora sp.]|uniref:hypothetical protein n=1 Tax=Actinokineospora sp. TaxID=1872133 RepID=UPI0040380CED